MNRAGRGLLVRDSPAPPMFYPSKGKLVCPAPETRYGLAFRLPAGYTIAAGIGCPSVGLAGYGNPTSGAVIRIEVRGTGGSKGAAAGDDFRPCLADNLRALCYGKGAIYFKR